MRTSSAGLPGTPAASGIQSPDRALTFLVLGVDRVQSVALADTVLIAHVPRGRDAVYLVSVPRDVRMAIPGHGVDKINSAYYLGGAGPKGAGLVRRTLTDATGLTFDGTVVVDYRAVRRLTDEVGGVRLCLATPVRSMHTRHQFPAGCQSFTGAQAVDLLRQRYGMANGAYDRDRHGRQFVQALVQRADSMGLAHNPMLAERLLRSAGPGLTVDTGELALTDLLGTVIRLTGAPVRGIGAASPSVPGIREQGYEELYPGVREQLFAAVREDRLDQWLAAHPTYADR
jgi:LCP family protein required for cell wall assembly